MSGRSESPSAVAVTGAAGATGAALARRFFASGAALCLIDLDRAGLETLGAEFGDRALCLAEDISEPDAAARIVAACDERFGPVGVLINNAGVLSNNKVAATGDAEWRRMLAVNLDGAFFLCRAMLPAMRRRRFGRVINICSLAMKTGGLTAGTAYTVSKGALGALTFSLARECAGDAVTVNAIAPAYVRSPMITGQLSEDQRAALLRRIPLGRFCEPEEVAELAFFLASDSAGFITGEIVDINGGLHMD